MPQKDNIRGVKHMNDIVTRHKIKWLLGNLKNERKKLKQHVVVMKIVTSFMQMDPLFGCLKIDT